MFPYLSHQPGYNKRLRAALPLVKQVIRDLAADSDFWLDDVWIADSTPVECARSRPAVRHSDMAGWANYGYCASHSRWFWGLRVYMICTSAGMPVLWALADTKIGEREVLAAMLDVEPQLAVCRPGLTLITGKGFAGREMQAGLAGPALRRARPTTGSSFSPTLTATAAASSALAARRLAPHRREPLPGQVELTDDVRFDVLAQRGIWPGDELAQHRHQRGVLGGQLSDLGPGGVHQAHAVVSEIRGLDDPGPGIGGQTSQHVLAVLLVAISPRLPVRVGDRADQGRYPVPELCREHGQGRALAGSAGQLRSVVFDRIVQQCGADHVGVGDAVVADDPDGDPQQVIEVGLTLSLVGGVQPCGEVQCPAKSLLVRFGQAGYLDREPVPQPGFAVPGRDRVQRHGGQEPPFAGVHAATMPGHAPGRHLSPA
jgi:hypothetical protein